MKVKIEKMIASKRLHLTKKQILFHYFFVLFLPLTVILLTQIILFVSETGFEQSQLVKSYVLKFCGLFSVWYFLRQFFNLRMTEFHIELSKEEFEKRIMDLVPEMNWIIESRGENYMVCTTEFKPLNWGTLVTIIRTENSVLVNSICDLYNRPSTFSFGQNKRNLQALKSAFS